MRSSIHSEENRVMCNRPVLYIPRSLQILVLSLCTEDSGLCNEENTMCVVYFTCMGSILCGSNNFNVRVNVCVCVCA